MNTGAVRKSLEAIAEIAQVLQQQNLSNADIGPRTVWLLLERIKEEASAVRYETLKGG
jgi:hypothetical protein